MSMPESDIFPQIVPRNDEVINTDKEDSVEDQVYELVISSNGDDKEKFAKKQSIRHTSCQEKEKNIQMDTHNRCGSCYHTFFSLYCNPL